MFSSQPNSSLRAEEKAKEEENSGSSWLQQGFYAASFIAVSYVAVTAISAAAATPAEGETAGASKVVKEDTRAEQLKREQEQKQLLEQQQQRRKQKQEMHLQQLKERQKLSRGPLKPKNLTLKESAQLANLVYDVDSNEAEELGFKLVHSAEINGHIQVGFYARDEDDSIVVAIRGTDNFYDKVLDVFGIGIDVVINFLSSVYYWKNEAPAFSDMQQVLIKEICHSVFVGPVDQGIVKEIKSFCEKSGCGLDKMTIVGHSMGGYFAQMVALQLGLPGASFNSPGLGSYRDKEMGALQAEYVKKYGEDYFVNHVMDGDVVSLVNSVVQFKDNNHLGPVIVHSSPNSHQAGLSGSVQNVFSAHGIQNFVDHLEQQERSEKGSENHGGLIKELREMLIQWANRR